MMNQMLIGDLRAKTINLVNNNLDISDIELLCYCIENSKVTEKMILSGCSITNEKAALIARAISKNIGIYELILSDNNIDDHGIIAINNALLVNENVPAHSFSLNLSANLFNLTAAKTILLNNSKLKYLNLNANFSSEGDLSFDEEYEFRTRCRKRLHI